MKVDAMDNSELTPGRPNDRPREMRGLDMTPRRRQGISALLLTGLLLGIVTVLPMPYVSLSPGPTFNTLGEVKGVPLVKISGHKIYETTGQLDMVTVHQSGGPEGGLTLGEAVRAWIDPASEVTPSSVMFAPGSTNAQVKAANKAMFTGSQSAAVAAAMAYLKIPTTTSTIVSSVVTGLPADGPLEPGDQIVSINGVTITGPKSVTKAIRPLPIGSSVTFVVLRHDARVTATMKTIENPKHKGTSYVGIMIDTYAKAPFPIDFTLAHVGGPSAGMMFTLALIDKLTPGAMANNQHIVGTGTIDPTGEVGGIGGIAQKMISAKRSGASLFLAPSENCVDVIGHIPDGLQVVRVATLEDAVKAVTAYGRGSRSGPALSPCTSN
ncbi:MAG: S16 family serine protease [Actinomycetes bacterium]